MCTLKRPGFQPERVGRFSREIRPDPPRARPGPAGPPLAVFWCTGQIFNEGGSPMDVPVDLFIRAGQPDTTEALRAYATRKLSFALRRFTQRVRHVTLRLVDENGPRKGVDSRCSITIELSDGRRIFVDAIAAWPFTAITQAARRLNEALRRDFDRQVDYRSRPAEGSPHLYGA
jgi:ribosome-associated translation inhibitor RaiA